MRPHLKVSRRLEILTQSIRLGKCLPGASKLASLMFIECGYLLPRGLYNETNYGRNQFRSRVSWCLCNCQSLSDGCTNKLAYYVAELITTVIYLMIAQNKK